MRIHWLLLGVSAFVQFGCENNLRDVENILHQASALPVDKSSGVEMIYSDSAMVKARIEALELFHFKTNEPYYEMNKGVTVTLFDKKQQTITQITADSATQRENENKLELRGHVLATVGTGEEQKIFESEELIWDPAQQKFYSDKRVSITGPNQKVRGSKFWANEQFTYYEIQQSSGDFQVSEK